MDLLKLKEVENFRDKELIRDLNTFAGNNLRNIIAEKGMKQIDVAVDLGLTEGSWKTTLGGGHCIDTTKYLALLALYGINPLEIMLGKDYIKILGLFPEKDRKGRIIAPQMDYVLAMFDDVLVETKKMKPDDQEKVFTKMATKIILAK